MFEAVEKSCTRFERILNRKKYATERNLKAFLNRAAGSTLPNTRVALEQRSQYSRYMRSTQIPPSKQSSVLPSQVTNHELLSTLGSASEPAARASSGDRKPRDPIPCLHVWESDGAGSQSNIPSGVCVVLPKLPPMNQHKKTERNYSPS
eukprot:Gregarina_sp_Poly_1__809@NODE_1192_length_4819_cov_79_115320_g819_i0_p5_GENE_NODE_1192_length_4819_cov_79_115320_g819_i0NODE_1192_length_4819_cov_79_115320_g819_i0_p5_ORF_typecomplete_len149_score14_14_NODE_1192_length_4819_cov_79_115320_g819_i021822628